MHNAEQLQMFQKMSRLSFGKLNDNINEIELKFRMIHNRNGYTTRGNLRMLTSTCRCPLRFTDAGTRSLETLMPDVLQMALHFCYRNCFSYYSKLSKVAFTPTIN